MSHLTKTQLQHLNESLQEEKQELENHFNTEPSASPSKESLRVSTGELSTYDNHPADVGTETFERSRDMAVDDNLARNLEEINRALDRIKDASYGTCSVCGNEIPYERLETVPYTEFCVEHTPGRNVGDYRPVEENLITPPPKGAGENRQRDAGKFDDSNAWHSLAQYGNSDSPALAAKRNVKDYDSLSVDED
ncbi:TraR/DksA family transcriptional regulator [Fontibacillus phaseoli]|uniref:TraR/DksA family transcriptional regulator n=1 Tax=Fontibacillus phaseoli TaxID=1416533 RepID=A0A369BQE0_9BACL|nr:TraR/DksA C4-type zinc finger protein [Fontibacillus phaseoli]RCX23611.1 TraR/DksA family transcriptional regulator [Fontibacillus phaseoli]